MSDYTSHFGLEFDPFLKNSKPVFIHTSDAKEASHRLGILTRTKGFGLLTGAPGTGKTSAVRNWSSNLNPSLYKIIYSSLSTLTVQEFYKHLALNLGVQPSYRKVDNFRLIQDEISRYWISKRITLVFVMDEANHISPSILNDLKILFNFEMDSQDRAIILLVGLPQINHTLRLNAHEALRQRIVMNYNMEGLSKAEGRSYISEMLRHAGSTFPVFDDSAIEAILNKANGIPRVINRLCSSSLLIADSLGKKAVSLDSVTSAIDDRSFD